MFTISPFFELFAKINPDSHHVKVSSKSGNMLLHYLDRFKIDSQSLKLLYKRTSICRNKHIKLTQLFWSHFCLIISSQSKFHHFRVIIWLYLNLLLLLIAINIIIHLHKDVQIITYLVQSYGFQRSGSLIYSSLYNF